MKDKYFKFLIVIIILVVAVFLDQWTKIWAENNLSTPRFPEHTVTKTVQIETPTTTLEDYLKAEYPKNNEGDIKRMMGFVTKDGQRVMPQDQLANGEQIQQGYTTITVIDGYYDYQYARNPGAAFSFLADQSPNFRKYFFGITGILAVILILVFIGFSDWRKQKPLILALGCVLGGAVGNIIDRFQYGYVIDFISWHYKDVYYWPTFNIADVFVTCGVIFLVLDMIINHKKYDEDEAKKAEITAEKSEEKDEKDEVKEEKDEVKEEKDEVKEEKDEVKDEKDKVKDEDTIK